MKAAEYLKRYLRLCHRIRQIEEEINDELEMGKSVSDNDGMPHGTAISKPTENKVERIERKRMEYQRLMIEALEERQKIFDLIIDIGGIESEVLKLRYIDGRKWEEICVLINYSWVQTHEYHKRALRRVREIIDRIEPNTEMC